MHAMQQAARSWWLGAMLGVAAGCGPNERPASVDATPASDARLEPAAGCSSDLRDVLDADGGVLETCAPDQGCADGVCVPACEAAAASRGSLGCDYLIPTPSFNPYFKPPCFAVFVTSYWPRAVPITVERDGATYDVTAFGRLAEPGVPVTDWAPVPAEGLAAGQVAVLFMSDDPDSVRPSGPLYCPVEPALRQSGGTAVPIYGSPEGATGRGAAWHLTAGSPVTVYDILPFGGAASWLPSAQLVLPTSAWGTNYYGIVPYAGGFDSHPLWGQLVAAEDGTVVTVRANVALPAGPDVEGVAAGAQHSFRAGRRRIPAVARQRRDERHGDRGQRAGRVHRRAWLRLLHVGHVHRRRLRQRAPAGAADLRVRLAVRGGAAHHPRRRPEPRVDPLSAGGRRRRHRAHVRSADRRRADHAGGRAGGGFRDHRGVRGVVAG
jgi:hypothetical protein